MTADCDQKTRQLDSDVAEQNALPAYENPKLLVSKLNRMKEDLTTLSRAIMSKPKPVVVPPTPETPDSNEKAPDVGVEGGESTPATQAEMDLD